MIFRIIEAERELFCNTTNFEELLFDILAGCIIPEILTRKLYFFDDYSVTSVLKKAQNRSEWDEKFSRYKMAKEAFLNMKSFK